MHDLSRVAGMGWNRRCGAGELLHDFCDGDKLLHAGHGKHHGHFGTPTAIQDHHGRSRLHDQCGRDCGDDHLSDAELNLASWWGGTAKSQGIGVAGIPSLRKRRARIGAPVRGRFARVWSGASRAIGVSWWLFYSRERVLRERDGVKVSIKAGESANGQGVPSASSGQALRFRKAIRFASRLAPFRMTSVIALLLWSGAASATTYYVSSSTGNDGNRGTSAGAAWQTITHVNGQTFAPGDSILFRRGDVWNESLVPASSGAAGNPITFDAYGTGAPPNLTGYYAVPSTAWVHVTGNAWKAPCRRRTRR